MPNFKLATDFTPFSAASLTAELTEVRQAYHVRMGLRENEEIAEETEEEKNKRKEWHSSQGDMARIVNRCFVIMLNPPL